MLEYLGGILCDLSQGPWVICAASAVEISALSFLGAKVGLLWLPHTAY